MKKKIAILGVGLMGGALGMALKKCKKKYSVLGIGRNVDKLKTAKRLGAIDSYSVDWENAVKDADIIVVCTPVNLTHKVVKRIAVNIKKSAVITDVGSTKEQVLKSVRSVLGKNSGIFVGSHPMAGSEKTGVINSGKVVLKGSNVCVAFDGKTDRKNAQKIIKMWKDAGAKVTMLSPRIHDKIVSITSHLPHVIAYTISKQTHDLYKRMPEVRNFLAGSFKDMTRIADSNPEDWAVICTSNNRELSASIKTYTDSLLKIKKNLKSESKLGISFQAAKYARQKLLNK